MVVGKVMLEESEKGGSSKVGDRRDLNWDPVSVELIRAVTATPCQYHTFLPTPCQCSMILKREVSDFLMIISSDFPCLPILQDPNQRFRSTGEFRLISDHFRTRTFVGVANAFRGTVSHTNQSFEFLHSSLLRQAPKHCVLPIQTP